MHRDIFLNRFGALAQGPNGVDNLRKLVLHLAVSGKLTEQDSSEDAAKLVHEIHLKKAALIEADKVKVPSSKRYKGEKNDTYPIPQNWQWCSLEEISEYIQRGKGPKYSETSQIPVISQKCIQWSGFDITRARYLDESTLDKYASERFLREGDLLWNSTGTGTIGRINIFPSYEEHERVVADSHVTVVRIIGVLPSYAWCFLASPLIQNTIEANASGSTNQVELSTGKVKALNIPVPPAEEQKRIVAKVKELMACCDELEREQFSRVALKRKAVCSTLHHFLTTYDRGQRQAYWNVLSQNWSNWFDDENTIVQLRKTFLELAFKGMLVAQHPYDIPADKSLKSIIAEVRNSKINKPRKLRQDGAKPYKVPSSWSWARFWEIGEFGRGKSKHRPRNDPSLYSNGTYPLVQTGDVAQSCGKITTFQAKYNEKGLEQSRLWNAGTLCITIAANIADTGILMFDACFPDSVVGFVPHHAFGDARYFEYFLRTAKADLLKFAPSTAQKNINLGILDTVLIPIPPLAEQQRIVAKLDEAIALCDELEAQVREGKRQNDALMQSLIHHIANDVGSTPSAEEVTIDTIETKRAVTNTGNVAPISNAPPKTPQKPSKPKNEKFEEAVLVGAIVHAFFKGENGGEPIGNFRIQKAVYFARRHMGEDLEVQKQFLRKAAGPYNPSMKYSGGIKIAKINGYIKEAKGRYGFGHITGSGETELLDYIEKYDSHKTAGLGLAASAAWVRDTFKYMTNEEWELIASVDYAVMHLQAEGIQATAQAVLHYIDADPEWHAKVEKLSLTEAKVQTVIRKVESLFPDKAING